MKNLSKINRIFFNLFWIILTVLVLFVSTGILLTHKYGDIIQEKAIEQINRELDAKISVDNIEISFFSKIPYVSIVLENVVVWSPDKFDRYSFAGYNCDTLLNAEKIYLQFNLVQILQRKFNIKRILAVNGNANVLIDETGMSNLQIVKKVEGPNNKDKKLLLELQAFRLSNFNIEFVNLAKNIKAKSYIKDILLKAKISDEIFSVASSSSIILHDFSRESISYANDYDISFKILLEVKDKIAQVKNGNLSVNNVNFSTSGEIKFGNHPDLNLEIQGRGLDINTILKAVNETKQNKLPFSARGSVDIAMKLNGEVSPVKTPEIKAVYVLNVNSLDYKEVRLNNIRIKGKYSNGKKQSPSTTTINIEKYQIRDALAELEGNFHIENLLQPEIKLFVSGTTDIVGLNEIIKSERISGIYGNIQPDLRFTTKIASLKKFKISEIVEGNLNGKIGFINTGFVISEDEKVDNLNGNMIINNDSWQNDFSFSLNDKEVKFNGTCDYLLKYILDKQQPVWLDAKLEMASLQLAKKEKNLANKKTDRKSLFLPKNIYAKIDADINSFQMGEFQAQNIVAKIDYKPGLVDLSSISMHSMNGSLNGNALLVQNPSGDFILASESDLSKIDISLLFKSFNNFKQKVIKWENIKGRISGGANFSIQTDSMLKIKPEELFLNGNISIKEGELIDFEPANRLSRFVELDELKDIKFSEINNTIHIQNEIISIANMDITSNAFDISVSGIYRFDKYFNYKLKVNLGEILASKAAKSKIENEENFILEKGERKASLYLSIEGKPDDYKIKYDKKEAISNIRKDLKEEKKTIKNILNEEFGWFKKDSLTKVNPNAGKEIFIIDWEEEKDSVGPKTKKSLFKGMNKKKAKEQESFKFEWDEDDN